jgi:hypothetical protein
MQTVGEKLVEARQRQGVRIQDAADSTHVRSDYLEALENNQFDQIPLTEVYRRGFLKIYARYLRLDPERILSDYALMVKGSVSVGSSGLQKGVVGRDDPDDNGGKGLLVADAGEVTSGSFPSPVQHGQRRTGGANQWLWVGVVSAVLLALGVGVWQFYFSGGRDGKAPKSAVRPELPPYTLKVFASQDARVTIIQRENGVKVLDNELVSSRNSQGVQRKAQGPLEVISKSVSNVRVKIGSTDYSTDVPNAQSFYITNDPAMTGIPAALPAPSAPAARR